jgi:predicted metal-dependent hydrolase
VSEESLLQLQLFPRAEPAQREPARAPAAEPAALQPALQPPVRNRVDEANRVALPAREEVWARAESLAYQLSANLGLPVRLSVTDNRSTMVSFRRGGSVLQLRLHHMFLDAPEPVVRAVADYAGRGHRPAGDVLDDYIRGMQPRIRQQRRGADAELNARGRCFDLQEMFDRVNGLFFQGGIQARIGWGRMPPRRRRKSIRLGVYDHQTREIRIHPALDRPEVPAFFVEFIVFHEMLHQLFPSNGRGGRRVHHPRAFRDREKAYPLYAAALRWERENLRSLLRA